MLQYENAIKTLYRYIHILIANLSFSLQKRIYTFTHYVVL